MLKEIWVEILTEEPSMENFLRGILPHILPIGYVLDQNCFIRPHEGKSHLKKSIPRKVKAFVNYQWPVKLIVIHDQDSNDCIELKAELKKLSKNEINTPTLIRIACRELENWYLGDLHALHKIYPDMGALNQVNIKKYSDADRVYGAFELEKLYRKFSKSHASREIPQFMNIDSNTSLSFKHLISGIKLFLSN
jgi:hypothetical protein